MKYTTKIFGYGDESLWVIGEENIKEIRCPKDCKVIILLKDGSILQCFLNDTDGHSWSITLHKNGDGDKHLNPYEKGNREIHSDILYLNSCVEKYDVIPKAESLPDWSGEIEKANDQQDCPHCHKHGFMKNQDGERNKYCGFCGHELYWTFNEEDG